MDLLGGASEGRYSSINNLCPESITPPLTIFICVYSWNSTTEMHINNVGNIWGINGGKNQIRKTNMNNKEN